MENIDRIIKYGLMVAVFAPIVVTSSTFFPFVFGKAFFFQIIIEICFFLWVGLLFLNYQKYKPQLSMLSWVVFAFLGILLLSSLLGPDTSHSLWGNYERMEGWITLAHYGAFFLLLGVFYQTTRDWVRILRAFLGASFLCFLYGLGQKWGWSFVVGTGRGMKMAGPLGNTVLFASFLLFSVFLAVGLFFWDENRRWRIFYGVVFVTSVLGIIFSASQGPLAGGLVGGGFCFLSLAILLGQENEYKKYLMAGGVAIVMLGFIFLGVQDQPWVQKNPILSQYTKFSLSERNMKSRLHNWRITWEGIKQRPILGYGQESNYIVFSTHYDPETLQYSNKWFDKPHNKYLEVLVTSGFVGFFSYLALFGLAIWILWKKRRFCPLFAFALMGFFIGYAIQLTTLFDTPSSYIAFFLFLGFVSRLSTNPKPESNKQSPQFTLPYFYGVIIAMLILAGLVVYQVNLKACFAAQNGIKGLKLLYRGKKEASLESFKRAARWDSFGQPEVAYQTSQSLTTSAQTLGVRELKPLLEFNLGELNKATRSHPLNPRLFLALGSVESVLARVDASHLVGAEDAFKEAHKLAPRRPDPFYKLMQVELMKQNKKKALSYAKKALDLNRDYNRSWWHLAEVNFARGKSQKGVENTIHAFQTNFPWKSAGSLNFATKKDYEKITHILERYLQAQPDDVKIHASLVMMYAKQGAKEKAMEHLEKAVELNPRIESQFKRILGVKQ